MVSRKGNGEHEMSRGSADHASDRASSSIQRHCTTYFPMSTSALEHMGILSNGGSAQIVALVHFRVEKALHVLRAYQSPATNTFA